MKRKHFNTMMLVATLLCHQAKAQNPTCIYTPYNPPISPSLIQGSGGNAVFNSDFETGNLIYWNTLPNASRCVISTPGNNSAYSLKLISQNNAAGDAFVTQKIANLTPGTTYTLSAWMMSNLASNNAFTADISIRFNFGGGNYQVISQSFFPTTTWTKFSKSFTVPSSPNVQECIVTFSTYRGQNNSVFVDDIELLTPMVSFGVLNSAIPQPPTGVFHETFKGSTGSQLSNSKWLVVKKAWGNNYIGNNNGVVPENLELLCDGGIRFHAHGDLYNGPIEGSDSVIGNGKNRVGACLATKDYYASGRYEVVAKLTPGVINAFWTFHYIEDPAYQNGGIKNSEIDWEFPSNNYNGNKFTLTDGLENTWGGLCDGVGLTTSGISHTSNYGVGDLSQDFHKYTIEWHTGGNGIQPSIKWYLDSVLVRTETNPTYIPFRASRFWIGVWFGNFNWITGGNSAVLQYEDRYMEVKSVTITPFYEANDIYENETVPAVGFAGPSFYPTFPCNSNLIQRVIKGPMEDLQYKSSANINAWVNVSPVPAHDELNLEITAISNDYFSEVSIMSLNGQVMLSKHVANEESRAIQVRLDDNIAAGTYMLRGITKQGKQFIKKIQIQE